MLSSLPFILTRKIPAHIIMKGWENIISTTRVSIEESIQHKTRYWTIGTHTIFATQEEIEAYVKTKANTT